MQNLQKAIKKSFKELIPKYEAFFFDCDGVIWEEGKPILYAHDALKQIHQLNKKIFIVTNSSANTRGSIQKKFSTLFNLDLGLENIYVSSYLTALYIKNTYPSCRKIYVIGAHGLNQEINDIGLRTLWAKEHDGLEMNPKLFHQLETDENIDAVAVGLDPKINFYKYSYASVCIQKGAAFIAANEDANMKVGKYKVPGGGTIVKGLAHCSEKEPYVTGKPNPYPIDFVSSKFNIPKDKCLMIGDRLETDIQLGINARIDSLLVLTGVTTPKLLESQSVKKPQAIIPTFYAENLNPN